MIRTVIVDDERLARAGLRRLLDPEPDVEVVEEANDGPSAIAAIRQHQPDLVFLDIRIPGCDGFDVVEEFRGEGRFVVIIVTAYDAYAVKAFEANTVDYLLKPVDPVRLRQAINRARERLEARSTEGLTERLSIVIEQLQQLQSSDRKQPRLRVAERGRVIFVEATDVRWIEAAGNYARLHTADRRHLLRQTIGALETRLRGFFLRVSRSALVNLAAITAVEPDGRGVYVIYLGEKEQIRSTRAYRSGISSLLHPD